LIDGDAGGENGSCAGAGAVFPGRIGLADGERAGRAEAFDFGAAEDSAAEGHCAALRLHDSDGTGARVDDPVGRKVRGDERDVAAGRVEVAERQSSVTVGGSGEAVWRVGFEVDASARGSHRIGRVAERDVAACLKDDRFSGFQIGEVQAAEIVEDDVSLGLEDDVAGQHFEERGGDRVAGGGATVLKEKGTVGQLGVAPAETETRDGNIEGVEQQYARRAVGRGGVDVALKDQVGAAGDFHKTTTSGLCTASGVDGTVKGTDIFGPDDDLAAAATGEGIDGDGGTGADVGA